MSYCLNPYCKQPLNPDRAEFCLLCKSKLLLKSQYRAIQPLGEGIFSRTFLAENPHQLNQACVIKQFAPLPQIQSNSEAMAKACQVFEQEARQLIKLGEQYRQIPTPFYCCEQEKRLYLVRPYISGNNLWQEIQEQGAFNEYQVRELLYDVLPVLQLLHKRQLLHRSIKPTNIIKSESNRKFILIDFGISRQLSDTRLTQIGSRINTDAYLPIEQVRSGKAYPSSDLYSLGIICIQTLTGAQLDDLYDPLEGRWLWREYLWNIGTDVSDNLSKILEKLLKDSVKERYQSAAEILKDLYTLPSRGLTATPGKSNSNSIPTNKTPNWRCTHTIAGHLDTVTTVAFSPDSQTIASGSADKTIKLWLSATGKLLRTLIGHVDTVTCVAFSPDGKTLASSSADKTIKIWQYHSGKLIHTLTGHSVTVFSVAFSPDGEILASGSGDGTIKLWNSQTGKLINVLTGHSDFVESVVFSPDGQTLASASWDNTIKIWQLQTGKLLHQLKGHTASIWSIAFSPKGEILASNSGDNTIKIWNPENGILLHTLTERSDSAWSIAFGSEGQILASDSGDNTIKIWDLATRKLLRTLSGHLSQVRSIAFSPNGQVLASGSDEKMIKIWQGE